MAALALMEGFIFIEVCRPLVLPESLVEGGFMIQLTNFLEVCPLCLGDLDDWCLIQGWINKQKGLNPNKNGLWPRDCLLPGNQRPREGSPSCSGTSSGRRLLCCVLGNGCMSTSTRIRYGTCEGEHWCGSAAFLAAWEGQGRVDLDVPSGGLAVKDTFTCDHLKKPLLYFSASAGDFLKYQPFCLLQDREVNKKVTGKGRGGKS